MAALWALVWEILGGKRVRELGFSSVWGLGCLGCKWVFWWVDWLAPVWATRRAREWVPLLCMLERE